MGIGLKSYRSIFIFFVFLSFSIEAQESGMDLIDKRYNSFISFVDNEFWISSEGGWNKYDGESVKHYVLNDTNVGLLGTFIQSEFLKDKDGLLWSSNYDHLCYYDYRINSFYSFQPTINGETIDHEIRLINYDSISHSIIFRGNESIFSYDIRNNRLLKLSDSYSTEGIIFLSKSDGQELFASPYILGQYLEKWTLGGKEIIKDLVQFSSCKSILNSVLISDLFFVGDDIWLLSNIGLIAFNQNSPCDSRVFLEGVNLIKSVTLNDVLIMTSHELGLVFFDLITNNLISTQNSKSKEIPLLSDKPTEIAYGNNEVFVSFRNIGIQRIAETRLNSIINFGDELSPIIGSRKILSNDSVLVYFNGQGNVYQYDNKRGRIKLDYEIIPTDIYLKGTDLYICNDFEIWKWNLKSLVCEKIYNNEKVKIQNFLVGPQGVPYFIASENVYNLQGVNLSNDSLNVAVDQTTQFVQTGKNEFIVCSTSDLYLGANNTVEKYTIGSYINGIFYVEKKNDVLLALKDGLGIFSINDKSFSRINTDGNQVDEIISFTNNGYLLRTAIGLYHLSQDYKIIKRLTYEEVTSCTVYQDKLLYLSDSGFHTLHINEVGKDSQDSIFIKNSTIPFTYNNGSYEFSYNYKDVPLEIDISSSTIKNNELGSFTYEIQYFNSNIQKLKLRDDIKLPILQEGRYNINIQGYNYDGTKANKISVIVFVKGPFWMQWWFHLSWLMLISLLIWKYFSIRTKRLLKESEVAEEIRQLEKSALQAQMNPHFIFNCLNSIQSFIMDNDKENAMDYLGRFAQLIRSNLNASVESHISLFEDIRILENYLKLEQLRLDGRFSFAITCDSGIDEQEVSIPPMLIQPFVENAVIHGMAGITENGLIKVNFSKIENRLLVSIEDNGNPKEQDARPATHKSLGVNITKQRLEHINRRDKDQVGVTIDHRYQGTLVSLSIEL